MDTMPQDLDYVIVGVDTHADTHVAVALGLLGKRLGAGSFPATRAVYGRLVEWASSFGVIDRIGIEGTGSWGRGLTLFCLSRGLAVRDVDRPDRRTRRRRGKTDLVDAEAAARAVLAGTATTLPKTADGPVEMIRVLHITRETAVKARTQAINQLRALVVTAPLGAGRAATGALQPQAGRHRHLLRPRPARRRPDRGDPAGDAVAGPAHRGPHRRDRPARDRTGPHHRPGPTAAQGQRRGPPLRRDPADRRRGQPDRLHSEAAFANLCASAPVPVNSGRSHRRNNGGHRQAKRALHTIVVSRIRWPDDRTRDYVTRRNPTGEFKADLDTIRRLKRYIAREVYPLIHRRARYTPRPTRSNGLTSIGTSEAPRAETSVRVDSELKSLA